MEVGTGRQRFCLSDATHSIGRDIKSLRPKSLDVSGDHCPASVDRKRYYGGPIGSHQRAFQRYNSRPRTASSKSSSPRLGFATPTQNSNRYYLRNW